MISKYPKPSPAKIASELFCKQFIKLSKLSDDIKEIALQCNKEIKKLNFENNPDLNYLDRDYWACVASFGIIQNNNTTYIKVYKLYFLFGLNHIFLSN